MCFTERKRFLVLYFSLTITIASGANTISANQSLSGDHTIISEGGHFELGFFKAGNSSNYYIGIWYKKLYSNPPTIVWVANRETLISDRFRSELKIIDGNLVLLNESKLQIWSTNVTTSTILKSAIAVILDDGNLVLRDSSNLVEPIWQSFDHPAHTWLPGANFGYDYRSKKSQLLTSWRSKEDPSVGLFSLEFDPFSVNFVSKWNGSQDYWTTGPWKEQLSNFPPDMIRLNYIYNFSFHQNENGSYVTYSPTTISRFVMDVYGQIQQQSWLETTKGWNILWSQPRMQCGVYALCGAFGTCRQSGSPFCHCLTGFKPRSKSDWNQSDFSGGCVRTTDLQCGENLEKTDLDFLVITVKMLPLSYSLAVGSARACRTTCLNDCSCNAYSSMNNTCILWDGDLLNIWEVNTGEYTIHVKVASKDLPRQRKSRRVTVVGAVTCVVFVLGIILVSIYIRKRISNEKTKMEGSLVAFVYKDLQIATKHFSEKLGGGGFGSVFKGVLRDSSTVAVKKLESISQGEKQFRSEVNTIGIIQHVHLVRLRGFCAQGNKKLLVYDYMANGSLDTHLFREKQYLKWKTRYQVALGTARGLVYLHDKCRDCIIHCDIKPENILLDAEFTPKIADFGLAKLVGRDFSRVLTTTRGSIGYLAPEWLSGVAITAKADVYSYGMMLFELVYGKRNAEQCEDSRTTFFPGLVANVLMEGGDILNLLDTRLNREACVEEVTKICKVACWCIQYEEESRPAMSQVERILEGVSDVSIPPIPQIVTLFVENMGDAVFFTDSPSNGCSQLQSNSLGRDSQSKSSFS